MASGREMRRLLGKFHPILYREFRKRDDGGKCTRRYAVGEIRIGDRKESPCSDPAGQIYAKMIASSRTPLSRTHGRVRRQNSKIPIVLRSGFGRKSNILAIFVGINALLISRIARHWVETSPAPKHAGVRNIALCDTKGSVKSDAPDRSSDKMMAAPRTAATSRNRAAPTSKSPQ